MTPAMLGCELLRLCAEAEDAGRVFEIPPHLWTWIRFWEEMLKR